MAIWEQIDAWGYCECDCEECNEGADCKCQRCRCHGDALGNFQVCNCGTNDTAACHPFVPHGPHRATE